MWYYLYEWLREWAFDHSKDTDLRSRLVILRAVALANYLITFYHL